MSYSDLSYFFSERRFANSSGNDKEKSCDSPKTQTGWCSSLLFIYNQF